MCLWGPFCFVSRTQHFPNEKNKNQSQESSQSEVVLGIYVSCQMFIHRRMVTVAGLIRSGTTAQKVGGGRRWLSAVSCVSPPHINKITTAFNNFLENIKPVSSKPFEDLVTVHKFNASLPTSLYHKQSNMMGNNIYFERMTFADRVRVEGTLRLLKLSKFVVWLGPSGGGKSHLANNIYVRILHEMRTKAMTLPPTPAEYEAVYAVIDQQLFEIKLSLTEKGVLRAVHCPDAGEEYRDQVRYINQQINTGKVQHGKVVLVTQFPDDYDMSKTSQEIVHPMFGVLVIRTNIGLESMMKASSKANDEHVCIIPTMLEEQVIACAEGLLELAPEACTWMPPPAAALTGDDEENNDSKFKRCAVLLMLCFDLFCFAVILKSSVYISQVPREGCREYYAVNYRRDESCSLGNGQI